MSNENNAVDKKSAVSELTPSSESEKLDSMLEALSSTVLAPAFYTPMLLGRPSSWWTHVPFAFWVMTACRPRVFVELGTHYGVSYAAFCEANLINNINARCVAVDTWQGDEHAGFFGDNVYHELRAFNDQRYGAFSTLIRSTFKDALQYIADGSVDLLHIDGRHRYEDVREDFETWVPKLSDRAVVLFHDTNVLDGDFGVHRYFAELGAKFPTFEFLHGFGLGIAIVGKNPPEAIAGLCAIKESSRAAAIRARFNHIGSMWYVSTREQLGNAQAGQVHAAADAKVAQAQAAVAEWQARFNRQGEAAKATRSRAARRLLELRQTVGQLNDRLLAAANAQVAEAQVAEARAAARGWETRFERQSEAAKANRSRNARRVLELRQMVETLNDHLAAASLAHEAEAQEAEARVAEAQASVRALEARFERQGETAQSTRSRAARRVVELRQMIETLNDHLLVATKALEIFGAATSVVPHRSLRARVFRSLRARVFKQLSKYMGHRQSAERREQAEIIRGSLYFNQAWYAAKYPDLSVSGLDHAMHYLQYGAGENRDPGPDFSTSDYYKCNPDVATAKVNALLHYEKYGRAENRSGGVKPGVTLPAIPARIGWRSGASSRQTSILWVSSEVGTPGHLYRVMRYIEAARENDVEAEWVDAKDVAAAMSGARRCSILILWRVPWNSEVEQIIAVARQNGATIVFDVDDLMINPKLADPKIIDGIRSQHLKCEGVRQHYAAVQRTMCEADLCYTTTEELAFHMRWAGKPTFVLPNGFDQSTHDISLRAAVKWQQEKDQLIRIGYAGGSRTHQKDFGLAVPGIVAALKQYSNCRLVLFRTVDGTTPLIDIEEFPALMEVRQQIEWRPLQKLVDLPFELARFDINIAPLEFGNAFCEAKSELKFFEAALVDVPTVASPTGPFLRAIHHSKTGFLAATAEDWVRYLTDLVGDANLRKRLAHEAYHAALSKFGPRQRALQFGAVLDQISGGARASRGFALAAARSKTQARLPEVYPSDVVFEHDNGGVAEVTVVVPSYNYERYIVETLDSVAAQTLKVLDLVIVDGCSPDNSLKIAEKWARAHAKRFNRIVVLKNRENYGLGPCRNSGFDAARSPYILPLDADNRLRPDCCEQLLAAIRGTTKAYVYPTIQHFGASSALISNARYSAQRFAAGNYVDAMALVSKEAWAMAGGYNHVRFGWEDYDLWCRFAEMGLVGEWFEATLADYRVHDASMMKQQTTVTENYRSLMANFEEMHPWVSLVDRQTSLMPVAPQPVTRQSSSRLDALLPTLRCPVTQQKLCYSDDGKSLVSLDRKQTWPIVEGRAILAPELKNPELRPKELISNAIPDEALQIIQETKGWVLNLSAGGSAIKHDHVIEVEYAVFRHTDVLADAHKLPFDDETFDAVISMNAFEHYKHPPAVAAELMRVLKPGGRIHVRTAFLQPLHEKPWHFYPCTRYGMRAWFEEFIEEKLHVSTNFCPNHTVAWIASEYDQALRSEALNKEAEAFGAAKLADYIDLWRDPSKRTSHLWQDFEKLSQDNQEIIAAGFEFFGRKPTQAQKGLKLLKS